MQCAVTTITPNSLSHSPPLLLAPSSQLAPPTFMPLFMYLLYPTEFIRVVC